MSRASFILMVTRHRAAVVAFGGEGRGSSNWTPKAGPRHARCRGPSTKFSRRNSASLRMAQSTVEELRLDSRNPHAPRSERQMKARSRLGSELITHPVQPWPGLELLLSRKLALFKRLPNGRALVEPSSPTGRAAHHLSGYAPPNLLLRNSRKERSVHMRNPASTIFGNKPIRPR